MKDFLPVITVFISGIFGLFVALTTSRLTNNKEKRRYEKELQEKEYKSMQDRYTRIIAAINKASKGIRLGEDSTTLSEDFSVLSAETVLMENEQFNMKFNDVDNALVAWSVKHHLASPKRLGDTGLAVFSSQDSQHKPEAIKLHEEFNKQMSEFIELMKTNLKAQNDN